MKYKYKFTCEYTKIASRPFEEIVEYNYEPSEETLQADYNDWLSNYIVGGYEKVDEENEANK